MSDNDDRKPVPAAVEPAQIVLNKFLKEHDILIGTDKPEIDFTNRGAVVISAPRIIAMYSNELKSNPKEVKN